MSRFRLGQYEVVSIRAFKRCRPLLYQELKRKGIKYMVINFDASFVKYFKTFKEAKEFVLKLSGFHSEEEFERWSEELKRLKARERGL